MAGISSWTPAHRLARRRGVTLVELLISVALTLLVILAIVRVFDLLGSNVTDSRAILELSGQLRTAAQRLQTDLDQLTLKPIPPADPLAAMGYFEIIEGIRSDRDNDGDFVIDTDRVNDPAPDPFIVKPLSDTDMTGTAAQPVDITDITFLNQVRGLLGDTDDVLMFTARSTGAPFRGRYNGQLVESPLAEIAWWLEPIAGPLGNAIELALVRRVLVIRPDLPILDPSSGNELIATPATLRTFLEFNDVSVRPYFGQSIVNPSQSGVYVRANRLSDLGTRRNRFAHWPVAGFAQDSFIFPDRVNRFYLVRTARMEGSVQQPELSDLVASDVMALDVRVFDPLAVTLRPSPTSAYSVSPVDPGFAAVANANQAALNTPAGAALFRLGAYVDLGYNVGAGNLFVPGLSSEFAGLPALKSRISLVPNAVNPRAPRVYDSWSTLYERDGWDHDNVAASWNNDIVEQGSDGFDQAPQNFVVDDMTERETEPPYAAPLSGIEVVLRLRDATTQQIRQTSVVADFAAP